MHTSTIYKSILLVATVSVVSGSKLHGSPGMSLLKYHHQLSRNLMPRQGCTSDQVTCGGGCLVAGSDCCTPGATYWEYCDPGQFCWSFGNDYTACCAPGDVQCGIKCMPPGSACCDNEGDYCDAGEYCFIDTDSSLGCCPQGETCGSSTTYQAGVTVTGPATASATTPASSSASEPIITMSSVSAASVESTTSASTAPPIATFTGGAVVTAGPQVAAAVLVVAGQMFL